MHRWLRLTLAPLAAVVPPLLLSLPLALGACSPDYPMDKPGTWSLPPGALSANDANLRVMIVNPQDLTTGEAADGSDATEAAPPVQRLNSGRRPPLPDISGTPLGTTGAQTSAVPDQAGTNGIVQ
jgi:hypothetical protein